MNAITPTLLRELVLDDGARLSAASALVRIGDRLFVIADDAHHLATFALGDDTPGMTLRLFGGELPAEPRERKRVKPDLEALLRLPPSARHPFGALLALGSGSKPNRCRGACMPLTADGIPDVPYAIDLAPLYAGLRDAMQVLNIEGALVAGDRVLLLQRGNDVPARNAAIALRLDRVQASIAEGGLDMSALDAIVDFDLGRVNGVAYGFSDGAALPDGRWMFAAIAEDTTDSYLDGACAGSAIGIVDADGRIAAMHPLVGGPKIEGIDARSAGDAIDVLMVTDADDPKIAARLLRARL